MRTPIFLLIFLFFGSSIVAQTSLIDALKQNQVKIDLVYNKFGKDAFNVKITNLTIQKLDVLIPSGMIFEPENEEDQTLMNVDEQFFAINGRQSLDKTIQGYCIMLSKNAPSKDQKFSLGMTNHKNLISFLDFVKKNEVTKDNYQSAIWAITDDDDIASIEGHTEADNALREFVAKMTGRKNPWYTKPTCYESNPGERIEKHPVSIEGIIEVQVEKDFEVYVSVENAAGKQKFKLKNMLMKKGVNNKFTFKVKASGWEVGDYKVIVRKVSDNSEVKSYPFTV